MYFHLDWSGRRPNAINLLKTRPSDINYEVVFNICKKKYILSGNIADDFIDYSPEVAFAYTKVPYLLSHLQKSIRRMDSVKAVKTAKHLIDLDSISFIRRLPIIMLEDVAFHESFLVIIWLMIAISKGYKLKVEIIKWLLGVVYYLSNEEYKEKYLKEDIIYEWDEDATSDNVNIILNTLRFRKEYGGMKGDMSMIEYYIGLVLRNEIFIRKTKIPIIKLDMESLRKKEWIYEANDFHCNRYIIDNIQLRHNRYTKEYLKQLIWEFSSSLNKREEVKEKDMNMKKDWDIIKKTVKRVQRQCIYY